MAHGVELLFPYLDTEVANVAMSAASELKVMCEPFFPVEGQVHGIALFFQAFLYEPGYLFFILDDQDSHG
jgi:hypothetical protein